jgi:RNA polymerase sigma-70 factor (ECF subfamily)
LKSDADQDHNDALLDDVTRFRPRLFGIAYRMLGSVVDAEDAVQETFLRWEETRAKGTDVAVPEAWLTSVATRLCIDQLRSARVRREQYVGEWLPEPLITDSAPDLVETVEMTESLSMAFLVLMERLGPIERAVFLLHDVFSYGYAEIAKIVDKSETGCRQLAKRARDRIESGRTRFQSTVDTGERLTSEFLHACAVGDLPGLLSLLTEDIELVADGGGKVAAARVPLRGADRVASALIHFVPLTPPGWTAVPAIVNGGPGLVVRYADGRPLSVMAFDLVEGRIGTLRIVANPDKLRNVPAATPSTG